MVIIKILIKLQTMATVEPWNWQKNHWAAHLGLVLRRDYTELMVAKFG